MLSIALLYACTSTSDDTARPWDAIDEAADDAGGAGASGGAHDSSDSGGGGGDTSSVDGDLDLGEPTGVRDDDQYRFTVPSPGYATITLTDVSGGSAGYELYADGTWLHLEMLQLEDSDLQGWFTVVSGVEYTVRISGSNDFAATLQVDAHALADSAEPDDSAAQASTLDDEAEAWFGPTTTDAAKGDTVDDWYRAHTGDGRFSVVLADIPGDLVGSLELYAADDLSSLVDWESAWSEGGELTMEVHEPDGGDWLVHVSAFGADDHGLGDVPAHLTQPYSLRLVE